MNRWARHRAVSLNWTRGRSLIAILPAIESSSGENLLTVLWLSHVLNETRTTTIVRWVSSSIVRKVRAWFTGMHDVVVVARTRVALCGARAHRRTDRCRCMSRAEPGARRRRLSRRCEPTSRMRRRVRTLVRPTHVAIGLLIQSLVRRPTTFNAKAAFFNDHAILLDD